MNRRGFFGWIAAAIGWLWGVNPAETLGGSLCVKPAAEYEWESESGAYGGFIVPAEFVPQIESMVATGKPITLEFRYDNQHLTTEQVCKLRGVEPTTNDRLVITRNEWRALLRSKGNA